MGAGKPVVAGGLFLIAAISYHLLSVEAPIPRIEVPPPEPVPQVIQVRGPVTNILEEIVSEVNNTRISQGKHPLFRSHALDEMASDYAEIVSVSNSVPLAIGHDLLTEKEKSVILYHQVEKHGEMYILPNPGESFLAELLASIIFLNRVPDTMEIAHIFDFSESHATLLYHTDAHHVGWAILDNGKGMYFIVVYLTIG